MADKENEDKEAREPAKGADPDEEAAATATAEEDADEEVVLVEDPAFEIDYKGDCAYEVKVTVPPANEQKQTEKMFDELKEEAEVPGFRRGRAPRKLIERKFAKIVRTEVQTKLVNAAFKKLAKDNDLKPYAPPEVEGLEESAKHVDEGPLTFTLKFEVLPRVELGEHKGVEVERPVLTVGDEEIDEAVEGVRSRYAVYETLKEGVAAEGDQVIMDFKGTVDGREFEGGSAENYPYILGTKRFFPEFEQTLLGCSPGDALSCNVTLPEDSPNEALRGKTAEFAIAVKEVKRRVVPELTDEFAKQAGYDNCEAMREKIAERLRSSVAAESNGIAGAHALRAIIDKSKIEIPKSLVDAVADDLHENEVRRLLAARVPVSEIQERADELRKRAQDLAVVQIQRMLVLNEICEAEGIEATEEDFEREAEELSQRTGVAADMVAKYLEREEQRGRSETRIIHDKALAAVLEHANITDVEASQEELEKAEAESEEA